MEIKARSVYQYKGSDYSNLDDVKERVENHIGAVIDSLDVTLTPKQKLNILAGIVKNKRLLVELLTVEFNNSDDVMYENMVNILDY